ncbi:MAG: molybdopterin converting factor subunit 1 [Candidatus Eisenbacteria bacterium]
MTEIRVLYFGPAAEEAGLREETITLAPPATLAGLVKEIVARHPRLAGRAERLRFAVNREYAGADGPLESGDEVAVIPPVAGGAPEPRVLLVWEPIDGAALVSRARAAEAGGVVLFEGTVRADEEEGKRPLSALMYTAFDEMAIPEMERIREEGLRRFDVAEILLVHRLGVLAVGETSVAVVASAPHRGAAFEACRFVIDELKARVPIWKKELREGGETSWVEGKE